MPAEDKQSVRVFAIVPAAGRSRRMGTAKQLLDIGGRTVLEALLEPLAAAEVDGVMLVTHSAIAGQIDLARFGGTLLAINDDPNSEMIDSVRIGLDAWQQRETIGGGDGFLVCPADQVGIATTDFNTCIEAFRKAPDRIVIATYHSRRGHPIVFPNSFVWFVRSEACDLGLRALPNTHAQRVSLVACPSPGVIRDVNTPEDYEQLR